MTFSEKVEKMWLLALPSLFGEGRAYVALILAWLKSQCKPFWPGQSLRSPYTGLTNEKILIVQALWAKVKPFLFLPI